MIRGARRYTLASDNLGRKNIQMRANLPSAGGASTMAGPASVTGTTSAISGSTGNYKKNWERYGRDLMEGFIAYNTDTTIRQIQNDMYFFDPITGSVVDIRSNLPFSNFELSGTESKERRQKYTQSVNAMQIRGMLPRISRERMVEGKHISYMNFDDSEKRFVSIIPYNPEFCRVTPIPVVGRDPLIDVTYPDHIINCVKSTDPEMREEMERYAEDLIQMVNEKRTRLNPKFTLYVARLPFSWSPYGISALRRLIPVWLYEKSLARGTIDLSGRRQKALLHLIMGDEEWLPTNEQLKQITQLFIDADNDPVGAMVATRPGIETNELRPGADHWRWDESWDAFTTMKLRCLGVPDSIFGDFNVQAVEQTISSVMEDMNNEREELTQSVFYNKMFPIIAQENDFMKSEKAIEMTGSDKRASLLEQYRQQNDYVSLRSQHIMLSADESIDPTLLDMPSLRWEKGLKIVSNDALFNNLGTFAERGMPAPLRMQAALLGLSAEDMFAGLNQDIEDRKMIAEYQKQLPQPPAGEGEDDGGGGSNMFMESMDFNRRWRNMIGSDIAAQNRKSNRDYTSVEQRDTHTGKVLSRKGRQVKVERENKVIAEALDRVRGKLAPKDKKRERSYSYSTKRKI